LEHFTSVTGDEVARQQQQQLVGREHPPLPVDDAQPVAVAVEGHAKVAAVGDHRFGQLGEVLRLRRVRVVRRKAAVDPGVEQEVAARQQRREALDHRPGRAVTTIPGDLQRRHALGGPRQLLDIGLEHRDPAG
jgi:hypothetical protein